MALTKVTKSGLADDSVDASKLEDGTIVAADINDGTITNAKLAGSIANNKLANSSITVNGTAVSLGGSTTSQHIDWQSVVTSNTTMVSGRGYFVNTTSGSITMTLPASPSAGDYVAIKDYAATFQTNSCVIARNGSNIQGAANNSEVDTARASVVLVYADATKGWLYTNESNVAVLGKSYVAATGGTESTSGDYKLHVFNSSSNFVVSDGGNSAGSNTVEYLVIAGGGSGGKSRGGGGGAGGYRTNYPSPASGGLSVTAQTYPITVGAGASAVATGPNNLQSAPTSGRNGSTSTFSTITSAGGGAGSSNTPPEAGADGGSGGGGADQAGGLGGSGNTPPVSPPQGNNGGEGGNPSNPVGGGPGEFGAGGGGGGSAGVSPNDQPVGASGAGGSGVVILRYKYQN